MKKCRLLFLLILLLSLCGCSMIPNILSESRIETLKSWSFQYNIVAHLVLNTDASLLEKHPHGIQSFVIEGDLDRFLLHRNTPYIAAA